MSKNLVKKQKPVLSLDVEDHVLDYVMVRARENVKDAQVVREIAQIHAEQIAQIHVEVIVEEVAQAALGAVLDVPEAVRAVAQVALGAVLDVPEAAMVHVRDVEAIVRRAVAQAALGAVRRVVRKAVAQVALLVVLLADPDAWVALGAVEMGARLGAFLGAQDPADPDVSINALQLADRHAICHAVHLVWVDVMGPAVQDAWAAQAAVRVHAVVHVLGIARDVEAAVEVAAHPALEVVQVAQAVERRVRRLAQVARVAEAVQVVQVARDPALQAVEAAHLVRHLATQVAQAVEAARHLVHQIVVLRVVRLAYHSVLGVHQLL